LLFKQTALSSHTQDVGRSKSKGLLRGRGVNLERTRSKKQELSSAFANKGCSNWKKRRNESQCREVVGGGGLAKGASRLPKPTMKNPERLRERGDEGGEYWLKRITVKIFLRLQTT